MTDYPEMDAQDTRENMLALAERSREGDFVILVTLQQKYLGLVEAKIEKFAKIAKRHNQEFGVVNRKTWNVEQPHILTGRKIEVPYIRLAIQIPAFVGQKGKIVAHFERAEDGTSFYTHVFDETRRAEAEAYVPKLGICEHCNTKRRRNDVFVCDTDDGVKIVGSDCLKDYLGIDPVWAMHALEFVRFAEVGDDEWEERLYGARDKTLDTDDLVRTCYRVAKKFGGYSRAAGDEMRKHLSILLYGPGSGEQRKYDLEIEAQYRTRSFLGTLGEWTYNPDFDVNAFINYIENMTGDFGSNMRIAISQNRVHQNRTNIVLAGVGLFVGKIVQQIAETAKGPDAKLVAGNPGDRCTFYGTVLRAIPYTNDFGMSKLIVVVRCDDGENLVNFHTGADTPEAGRRYALTFTIKKHGTDKRTSEPQTVVSRVVYGDPDKVVFKAVGVAKPYKPKKAA